MLLLGAAGLATVVGVDSVRRPLQPKRVAQEALQQALELGNKSPEVRTKLLEMRRVLGRRPLETRIRVVYASMLVGLSGRLEDTQAAAFHASRAAELSPVTVPVVQLAAQVLARTGQADEALQLTRRMFGYDRGAAAELLAQLEPLVFSDRLEIGLADDPDAWLAWSYRLRTGGRGAEADRWIDRAHGRWPDHMPTLHLVAARAVRQEDWQRLAELIPPERPLPDEPPAAAVLLDRARLRIERGDREGAQADIDRALDLAGEARTVRILAGEAYEALGRIEGARQQWGRALNELGSDQATLRRDILVRMARLEDRHGRPAAALRLWRSILDLDAEHVEARRRVDDLTNFQR